MDNKSVDEHMRNLDAKLRRFQAQTEISRLQSEISLLEQKCLDQNERSYSVKKEPKSTPGSQNFGPYFPSRERGGSNMTGRNPTMLTPLIREPWSENTDAGDPWHTGPKGPVSSTPRLASQDSFRQASALNAKDPGGMKMKPATYDGTGSWKDYKAHFGACARINKWNEEEKCLYLSVSMRGQAQGILGNLAEESNSFDQLMRVLEE